MPKRRRAPEISPRKTPRQERSTALVAAILDAAVRVLARDGARRFTTVRVAEEAGVSVGSLYQYFPNKEALLFRLQADEWSETGDILGEILDDQKIVPERVALVWSDTQGCEAEVIETGRTWPSLARSKAWLPLPPCSSKASATRWARVLNWRSRS